jgi:hypothetical protein
VAVPPMPTMTFVVVVASEVVGAVGHGANSQVGPKRPTVEPSGHILASMVHAVPGGVELASSDDGAVTLPEWTLNKTKIKNAPAVKAMAPIRIRVIHGLYLMDTMS